MSDTTLDTSTHRTGFVENEPVIVGHFVLWLFVNLGAFIVGHTNLVTSDQWNSLTTGLVPFVTAALLSVIAFVVRKYVSPAWKKVSGELESHGFPIPTGDQLDSIAEEIYEAILVKQIQSAAVAPEEKFVSCSSSCKCGASSIETVTTKKDRK